MFLKNRSLNAFLLGFFFSLSACKNNFYTIFNQPSNQKTQISQLLSQKNKDLLNSANQGDLKGVKKALKKGADINAVDYNGNSALMKTKTKAIAELLLSEGANIELSNEKGETALIIYSKRNNIEIITLLLNKGADPNKETHSKKTALMEAAANKNNVPAVDLLISRGADVDAVSQFGDTALLVAILNNNTESAKALLNKGANAEIRNQAGWTAKMAAQYFKQTDLIHLIQKIKDKASSMITAAAPSSKKPPLIQNTESNPSSMAAPSSKKPPLIQNTESNPLSMAAPSSKKPPLIQNTESNPSSMAAPSSKKPPLIQNTESNPSSMAAPSSKKPPLIQNTESNPSSMAAPSSKKPPLIQNTESNPSSMAAPSSKKPPLIQNTESNPSSMSCKDIFK